MAGKASCAPINGFLVQTDQIRCTFPFRRYFLRMPLEPSRQDEVWWERELLRNQKLMDKYQAAFEADPAAFREMMKEELNSVHSQEDFDSFPENELEELSFESSSEEECDWEDASEPDQSEDESNVDDSGYEAIKEQARRFGVRSLSLKDLPADLEVLRLSGAKIGANLAGGHGLGYGPNTICGNIVKCRWALSDSEFCREMLEYLFKRTGEDLYRTMAQECLLLSEAIEERIQRLRARSPWAEE